MIKSLVLILFILLSGSLIFAQTIPDNSQFQTFSSFKTDTVSTRNFRLKYADDSFGRKFGRAFGTSFMLNGTLGLFLVLAPDDVTMWSRNDKFHLDVIKEQYIRTFTFPPVIDHDLFAINYIGHPYQGSVYYNSMRSQGANWLQSSIFCVLQSTIWEYCIEGGMEQPSIQDMIVTPVLGSLVGELTFRAAVGMSKNGFKWYEKIATCIINPSYAINNGFQTRKKIK